MKYGVPVYADCVDYSKLDDFDYGEHDVSSMGIETQYQLSDAYPKRAITVSIEGQS